MYAGQVTVLDVIGTIVVLDLATGPVNALDFDGLAGDDLGGEGNWQEVSLWYKQGGVETGMRYYQDASGSKKKGVRVGRAVCMKVWQSRLT